MFGRKRTNKFIRVVKRRFLLTPRLREAHARLTEAVRRGSTALSEGTLERVNPDWVKFARAMMPLMHMPAEIMASELRKAVRRIKFSI